MKSNNDMASGDFDAEVRLPRCGVLIESHHQRPMFSKAMHAHEHMSLIYVASGRGRCIIEGAEYELSMNTAVVLKKGQKHQIVDEATKDMMALFVVYFDDLSQELRCKVIEPLLGMEPLKISRQYATQMRQELRRMLYEQSNEPSGYEIAIQQSLSAILLRLYRVSLEKKGKGKAGSSSSHDRVGAVLDYVASKYYENHCLNDVANMAHLSQRQFANVCRVLKGDSYVQYVNAIRTKHARELLENTTMPVSAVAFEVGYEELSTFYRAFKKHQGTSPLKVRE